MGSNIACCAILIALFSIRHVYGAENSSNAIGSPNQATISAPIATQSTKPARWVIPPFSTLKPSGELTGWSIQLIRDAKQPTHYTVVDDAELMHPVVEGKASAAAAALGVRLDVDSKLVRSLRFQWRVGNLIESSDPRKKEGDDYAARVYVTFATDPSRSSFKERTQDAFYRTVYGETPPRRALSYVFTHKAKLEDVIDSPFSSRIKKIVVDADPQSVGKWKTFERDVYADYKRAFNEEPTHISGIAIMVDTDNTGESASARFGDILLIEK